MIPFTNIEKNAFDMFQNSSESSKTKIEDFDIHFEDNQYTVFSSRQSDNFIVSSAKNPMGLKFVSRIKESK